MLLVRKRARDKVRAAIAQEFGAADAIDSE